MKEEKKKVYSINGQPADADGNPVSKGGWSGLLIGLAGLVLSIVCSLCFTIGTADQTPLKDPSRDPAMMSNAPVSGGSNLSSYPGDFQPVDPTAPTHEIKIIYDAKIIAL